MKFLLWGNENFWSDRLINLTPISISRTSSMNRTLLNPILTLCLLVLMLAADRLWRHTCLWNWGGLIRASLTGSSNLQRELGCLLHPQAAWMSKCSKRSCRWVLRLLKLICSSLICCPNRSLRNSLWWASGNKKSISRVPDLSLERETSCSRVGTQFSSLLDFYDVCEFSILSHDHTCG